MSGATFIYLAAVLVFITLTTLTARWGLKMRKAGELLDRGFDFSFALAVGGMLSGTLSMIYALTMHITENGL